ncbi:MAG: carboxypeptidase-like regulatory domain-containing protein [bacterium]
MSESSKVRLFLCVAVTLMGAAPRGKYGVEQVQNGAKLRGSVRTRLAQRSEGGEAAYPEQRPHLVDSAGRFEMDSIPAGDYVVTAWHPTLGEQASEVTLEAGQELSLNFELRTGE